MTASFKLRFLHRSAHYVSKYAHDLNARPSFFFLVFFSSLFTVLILQSLKSTILFQVILYRRVAAIIVRRLSSTQLSLTTRTNHGKRFVPVGLSQSDLKKQRAGGQSRLQTSRLHKVILLALKPPSLSLCSQLQHHTIMCRHDGTFVPVPIQPAPHTRVQMIESGRRLEPPSTPGQTTPNDLQCLIITIVSKDLRGENCGLSRI